MKKIISFLSTLMIMFVVSGCDNTTSSSYDQNFSDSSFESGTNEDSSSVDVIEKKEINLLGENYENCKQITAGTVNNWDDAFADNAFFKSSKFASNEQSYKNSVLTNDSITVSSNDDVKHIFYNLDGYARFVSRADGYAFSIPTSTTLQTDFSLGKYRSKLYNEEFTLTISNEENSNPYGAHMAGWALYRESYLFGYLDNSEYLSKNNITLTSKKKFDEETLNGYILDQYNLVINNPLQIKKNYYNIAVIREVGEYKSYVMLLMKSNSDHNIHFDTILKSYTQFEKQGSANNSSLHNLPIKENPNWNQETKDYYNLLLTQQRTDWGAFVANLPDGQNAFYQDSEIYKEKAALEEALDYNFDIIPTYQHLGWGTRDKFTDTRWPITAAAKMAGGNGFNNKPVVQMSYQFTINNNNVNINNSGNNLYTPMFDIYRGSYGDGLQYFMDASNIYINRMKSLARDIKAYGKPVLFRLNNEMNTDWTSYCAMMTLLDPDIFQATWRVIYNIFENEGVDNCIWIFNPFSHSYPTGKWSEDLCYYPGVEYVQALGLTYYEMNNDDKSISSFTFREDYTYLYNKNNDIWNKYPWIISEFACGSGGEASGKRYRNQASQVAYIKGMFADFNEREKHPYLQNIKGAVWFSVNDSVLDKKTNTYIVSNQLELDIANLPNSIQAFKDGLAKNKK